MKPNREAANKLLDIIDLMDKRPLDVTKLHLMSLASALIPTDDTYGHVKRLHELTGGNEQCL